MASNRNKVATSQPLTIETTAVSYTGTLTFDLVVEILSRLPVKSLMQLRCVCKSWNSLISDPKFAKKHLSWSQTQLNRHHVLSLGKNSESEIIKFFLGDTQLSSFFNSTSTTIPATLLRYPLYNKVLYDSLIGSCNGILCFSFGRVHDPSVMVWNPSIRNFKILPPLEHLPKLERTVYSFGYDCLTDTYKVVAIRCYEWDSYNYVYKIQVMLHTVGKDTWKTVEGFPSSLRRGMTFTKHGIFVSGAVNWLVKIPIDRSFPRVILSLDLGNESFQELLPPDCGKVFDLTFGVLRDCLCILAHKDTLVIHVWLMNDYGNQDSWTKLYTVPLWEISGRFEHAYPLYISEDDQLLFDNFRQLDVYNSRNGTSTRPKVESIFGGHIDWFKNHIYVESLIAP